MHVPLRFRQPGDTAWCDAAIENISHSGILFCASCRPADLTRLELMFALPSGISGQTASDILCQGEVVRSCAGPAADQCLIAVAIRTYEFIKPPDAARSPNLDH